jgi:hypothetical protein
MPSAKSAPEKISSEADSKEPLGKLLLELERAAQHQIAETLEDGQ